MTTLAFWYMSILMYVQVLPPEAVAPAGVVVVEISPGFRGVVVADWSPNAVAVMTRAGGFYGPDKAACEKWGDGVRREMAKEMKLQDYRQLKPQCTLRPVVQ